MFCMKPSPSSCWFANNVSALVKFPQKALRYCMRFVDLGLVNTFACLHHQEPVWLLPITFFSTDCAPPIVSPFSSRNPPNVVFQRQNATMMAQLRHRSSSLSSRWRNEASQVICASDHDFLHDVQLPLPHPAPPARRVPLFYQKPIPRLLLQFSKCFSILPSLHFSGRQSPASSLCACNQCHRSI